MFPENMGPRLAIDESPLPNGELYTFITNRDRHTREGSLVAAVAGTRSEDVIQVLGQVCEEVREAVEEVTPDLSDSMRRIVSVAFPKANDGMEECRLPGKPYVPFRFPNGDTRPKLLIRSRYQLFKSADKWTEKQEERARILFGEYPDIRVAYGLSHSLRMIFSRNTIKDAARLNMTRWDNKVEEEGMKQSSVIAATFYEHYDGILNFHNNRSSNAMAESFNAKIKLFRANLHGVADKKFFPFRVAKIYAYPH